MAYNSAGSPAKSNMVLHRDMITPSIEEAKRVAEKHNIRLHFHINDETPKVFDNS